MGVCVCQALEQRLVFLFPMQIVFVLYANLLEQMRDSKCLPTTMNPQNLQPAKGLISMTLKQYKLKYEHNKILPLNNISTYPASHIKDSPKSSTTYGNVLSKFLNIWCSSIREHSSTTRENKIRTLFFHPSLVTFPISNFVVWHIGMPYLAITQLELF